MEKLVLPESVPFVGVVSSVNHIDAITRESFADDAKAVIIEALDSNEKQEFIIGINQWDEFNLSQVLFPENIVNISFERRVANVTGYIKEGQWVAHTATKDSLTTASNVPAVKMDFIGVNPDIRKEIIAKREAIATAITHSTFRAAKREVSDSDLPARIELLETKLKTPNLLPTVKAGLETQIGKYKERLAKVG